MVNTDYYCKLEMKTRNAIAWYEIHIHSSKIVVKVLRSGNNPQLRIGNVYFSVYNRVCDRVSHGWVCALLRSQRQSAPFGSIRP